MFKRWQPSSRRHRRRNRGSSRTQGADKTFLIMAGLFALGLALVLALFLYLIYSSGG